MDAVYLCSHHIAVLAIRLNAGVVKTALNLKDNIVAQDFTSSSQGRNDRTDNALSAVANSDVGQAILVAASDRREAKAAYFYEMWFGDGAAALMVGDSDVIAEYQRLVFGFMRLCGSLSGGQRNSTTTCGKSDGFAMKATPRSSLKLFQVCSSKLSISMDDVDKFVFPCFFKAEHRKIAQKLGAGPEKLVDNLHEVCGETGTAHPLVMFVQALESAKPGDRILLAGFGQGCDALYFQVTEQYSKFPEKVGITGSLENKKTVDNYAKFLKFRDLIQTEMGIRAEVPSQTAMTVLWRNRKMLLGMVGGKCKKCGTPQFPKMDICVNPECRGTHPRRL